LLQVFYHLGDLDDALTYALGAGSLFDVKGSGEYVQTILGECCERHMCGTGARQLLL
jgi:26S proteasome regulatory subunit N2